MPPIITLLTDFGTDAGYAGAVSGVLLSYCPDARLVTIAHDVPAHDVLAGAFTLASAAPWFPHGTVHLAVVDPGVGGSRRGIVVDADGQHFVGPDNGIFTFLYQRSRSCRVHVIERHELGLATIHPTFHGRDLFAPIAGRLAQGQDAREFGRVIHDPIRLAIPDVGQRDGALVLSVLHIDRFGNVTTNATEAALARAGAPLSAARVTTSDGQARPVRRVRAYADARGGEIVLLLGSAGYLEIARDRASAAEALGISAGDELTLSFEA